MKEIEEIIRGAEKLEKLHREITKPKNIRGILEWIMEGFADGHCGPTWINGTARNAGVEAIIKELNALQTGEDKLIFQDHFEVVYKKNKKITVKAKDRRPTHWPSCFYT